MQVMLTIAGTQRCEEDEPQVTKLVTQGTLTRKDGKTYLSYEESEMTGMIGTTTTFCIEEARVTLTREGSLQSQMVFEVGVEDRSLYDMGFGALMIAVCAEHISAQFGDDGGTLHIVYSICIEQESAGTIEYHIEAKRK
ncbi:MAG: DUF1934 domain-containing protein [Oscillospiraceae bacterium]|jgi:uncharacterized beta-barrel protein YwiB (DUF1934 family)|nr:DUF1934 domain-containing protein [Oscillospiraceae bacterium]